MHLGSINELKLRPSSVTSEEDLGRSLPDPRRSLDGGLVLGERLGRHFRVVLLQTLKIKEKVNHYSILYDIICLSLLLEKVNFCDTSQMETRIELLFQFAPEKLGRFEKHCKNLQIFKRAIFFRICPVSKLVRSPVVYGHIPETKIKFQTLHDNLSH